MKLLINRKSFLEQLSAACSVAPAKSPKPILRNVLLREGSITANNMEIEATLNTDQSVKVEQPGELLIDGAVLLKLLSTVSSDEVSLESNGSKAIIRSGRSNFKIPTSETSEFPVTNHTNPESHHEIVSDDLKSLIGKTYYVTDESAARYALGGILLELREDGTVVGVATDGRRLAACKKGGVSHGGHVLNDSKHPLIVPRRSAIMIPKICKGGNVKLASEGNQLRISSDYGSICARLLEGRFPKWHDVIPKENTIRAFVDAAVLLQGVREASLVCDKESRGINFHFQDGEIKLDVSREAGETNVSIPIDFTGDITVCMDWQYVAEFLSACGDEKVEIALRQSDAPVLMIAPDVRYVIMPMSRNE